MGDVPPGVAAIRRRFAARLLDRVQEVVAATKTAGETNTLDDRRTARRLAHSLAGTAPTFGFAATGEASRAVEVLLDHTPEDMPATSPELDAALSGLVDTGRRESSAHDPSEVG